MLPPDQPPGTPPPPPPGIGRAAAATGAASLVSRVTGLVRDVVFAGTFGAGLAADAFFAAFRVPNLLRELLVEGTLVNVSVPLFAEADAREGRRAMWALANALLGALLVLLGLVTLLFLLGARPLVLLIASGFAEDPAKLDLATWLARLLAPLLAGLSVASLWSALLNVRGRFFLPALAPALINVATIAACLFAPQWEAWTGTPAIGAVAVATTISGLLTALVQLPALYREGYRLRPRLYRHPALGRALRFGGAALIGIAAVQINLIIETQLASRMGDGPVTWLILGFRLVQLPASVVAGSVAVAGLAGLSLHLARGEQHLAREALGRTLSLNTFLVAPMAVGIGLLAEPLARLFFERGAFTPADTLATAAVLRMYAIAALGICLHRVLLPLFFALGDPYLPMRLTVAAALLKLPVALLCTDLLGLGVAGLPLSHAILVSAEVAGLLYALSRRAGGLPPGFWRSQARTVLANLGLAAGVILLAPMADLVGGLGVLVVCGLGAVLYGGLALGLRIPEAAMVVDRLRRRRPPPRPGAA